MGRERFPAVPPNLGRSLNQKSRRDDRNRKPASLTGYAGFSTGYTLCPDNGGSSGTGYSILLSPCSSENHSILSFGWHSHQPATLCTVYPVLTFSLHSFCRIAYLIISKFIAVFSPIVKAYFTNSLILISQPQGTGLSGIPFRMQNKTQSFPAFRGYNAPGFHF